MRVDLARSFSVLAPALAALTLAGCNAAFWGNLVVLGVSVGIFFGTLALGRTSSATRSSESSTSSSSRS